LFLIFYFNSEMDKITIHIYQYQDYFDRIHFCAVHIFPPVEQDFFLFPLVEILDPPLTALE